MSRTENVPGNRTSLFVENSQGVVEVFFQLAETDRGTAMMPIGARPASGVMQVVSSEELLRAVRLRDWAENNSCVFEEGRVSAPVV